MTKRVSKGNKKLDKLIGFLFMFGLVLFVWEIFIYRSTIIELKIPLTICLTPGIILTPIFYEILNDIDGMKAHWSLHYVLHSCMTGSFILFTFMYLNFSFANTEITFKQLRIQKTGSLSGSSGQWHKRKPYVEIDYDGIDKQLLFSNLEMEAVMSSEFVELEVREGKFGFDILENYMLK